MTNRSKKQKEPFIQISSIILNSDAYKDLSFSARSMLIEMVNFHNGRNNGSIFIAKKVLEVRGFSKNTATKALKELRIHGFIYMTKRGGNIKGGCSHFALTWEPIRNVEGQSLSNFKPHAYKLWQDKEKKDRAKNGAVQTQKLGFELGSQNTADKNQELRVA